MAPAPAAASFARAVHEAVVRSDCAGADCGHCHILVACADEAAAHADRNHVAEGDAADDAGRSAMPAAIKLNACWSVC